MEEWIAMDRSHRASLMAQPKTVSPVTLAHLVAGVAWPEDAPRAGRYDRTYNRHNR